MRGFICVISATLIASGAIMPSMSYASEAPAHFDARAAAKLPHQKERHLGTKQDKHVEHQALWPVYFYGCDDQPDCF